jgi:predicted MFS family arabinose efflux permease
VTRLDNRLVLLFAVACGAVVANLYYAQPLLDTIAHALHVSNGTAGLLVTASQVGYAAGLVFIVPLGDLLERRRLIARMVAISALTLAVAAAAPSFAVLAAAIMLGGLASVVAQILVPFASTLAADFERGRVVGRVMSGLLIGILLARTVSGVIADLGGWRLVFALAAAAMLVLAAVLMRALPRSEPDTELRYPELLRSVGTLIRDEPELRRRMLSGLIVFANFSILWTSIAFLLSGAPFDYSDAAIGTFGLAGLAGAGAASLAGRFADSGHGRAAQGAFLLCVLAGWGLLALGTRSVAPLVAGIVVLDLGVQGAHILNQSAIYALAPEARSRVTTAYITSYFAGGAVGSAASSLAWSQGGWGAVTGVGAGAAVLALVVWVVGRRAPHEAKTVG